eukprot:m.18996 g.18996  ORF g.18996 m.18996 type:complete len:217 (+) comp12298_c0_seq1:89-739(+)
MIRWNRSIQRCWKSGEKFRRRQPQICLKNNMATSTSAGTIHLWGSSWSKEGFPKMIVFDVDYTLWPYWVDTHVSPPFTRKGSTVYDGSSSVVKIFPETATVLLALRDVPGLKIAFASRTGQPKWLKSLASLFVLSPQTTLWDLPDYAEIYPGSKLRHFKSLNEKSRIQTQDMLFFDDEPHSNREVTKLGVTFVDAEGGITKQMTIDGINTYFEERT